jgi:hypothetical protein
VGRQRFKEEETFRLVQPRIDICLDSAGVRLKALREVYSNRRHVAGIIDARQLSVKSSPLPKMASFEDCRVLYRLVPGSSVAHAPVYKRNNIDDCHVALKDLHSTLEVLA